jgi:hypothetical protein
MDVDGNRRHHRWNFWSPELFHRAEGSDGIMDRLQRRRLAIQDRSGSWLMIVLCMIVFLTSSTNAAFINFDNCLEASLLNDPNQLQFVPMFFSVVYDPTPGPNPLDIVIYGNVTGDGEIVNIVDNDGNETYTTLFTTLDVLTFRPYNHATEFCQNVTQGSCPLGPVYNVNGYDFGYTFLTQFL